MLRLHQQLYNAALEQRISAWRLRHASVSFAEQCRQLTELRSTDTEYRSLNAQSAQVTLKRLDRAFQAFFTRVKRGETPGFPRFKSLERFSGWGYKKHGVGFRFLPNAGGGHGRLRLSGVGVVPARGRARTREKLLPVKSSIKQGGGTRRLQFAAIRAEHAVNMQSA
jgi:putative transposase